MSESVLEPRSSFSLSSDTSGSSQLSQSSRPSAQEQVARALQEQKDRYDRRHKEVLAAQAEHWRGKMKTFCSTVQDRVASAERKNRKLEDDIVKLTRDNVKLEDKLKEEKERGEMLYSDSISARAELLMLERELMKMQKESTTNEETIVQQEARVTRLEDCQKTSTSAMVLAAALGVGLLAWARR